MFKFKQAYYYVTLLLFIILFIPNILNIYFILISIVIILVHVNGEEDDDLELVDEDDEELPFNEMSFQSDLDISNPSMLLFIMEKNYVESLKEYALKIPSSSEIYVNNNLYLSDYLKHFENYLQFSSYEEHENNYVLDVFSRNNAYSMNLSDNFFLESYLKMDNYPDFFFDVNSRSYIDFKNDDAEYFSFIYCIEK